MFQWVSSAGIHLGAWKLLRTQVESESCARLDPLLWWQTIICSPPFSYQMGTLTLCVWGGGGWEWERRERRETLSHSPWTSPDNTCGSLPAAPSSRPSVLGTCSIYKGSNGKLYSVCLWNRGHASFLRHTSQLGQCFGNPYQAGMITLEASSQMPLLQQVSRAYNSLAHYTSQCIFTKKGVY